MIQFDANIDFSSHSAAREAAVFYIGTSAKTSGKVNDYLIRKGFSAEMSTSVVSGLIEDGYINDERIARAILLSRRGAQAEGRPRLHARMLSRGVSESIAEKVLSESLSDSETITDFLRCFFKSDGPVAVSRDKYRSTLAKVSRLLVSRGYSYDLISYALSNFFIEVE